MDPIMIVAEDKRQIALPSARVWGSLFESMAKPTKIIMCGTRIERRSPKNLFIADSPSFLVFTRASFAHHPFHA